VTPKYLLDEQISPRAAEILRGLGVDCEAVSGSVRAGGDDTTIFRHAIREGRIMVTYDIADFVAVLRALLSEGIEIPGLVLIDSGTISTSEVGKLARALRKLAERIQSGDIDPAGGVFLHAG